MVVKRHNSLKICKKTLLV